MTWQHKGIKRFGIPLTSLLFDQLNGNASLKTILEGLLFREAKSPVCCILRTEGQQCRKGHCMSSSCVQVQIQLLYQYAL